MNHFHPEFEKTEYRGFVTAGKTVASLVTTYGGKALKLYVQDQDFNHVHRKKGKLLIGDLYDCSSPAIFF